jgi:phospholipid/cholesterol/gamma-HCH transport system substrate-binding protein
VVERIGLSADAITALGVAGSRASERAARTATSISVEVTRFTAHTLPSVESLLDELHALTISLRQLSEQTQRNPREFIFGEQSVPLGPGEEPVNAP